MKDGDIIVFALLIKNNIDEHEHQQKQQMNLFVSADIKTYNKLLYRWMLLLQVHRK